MVSFSFLNALDTATIVFIVLLVLLIVALLVVPMFTNKKRAKQTEELHRSLQPGDLVKTVGGVIGTIKEIRQVSPVDKEMVIETGDGDNKTTMVFDIQALYQVMSRSAASTVTKTDELAEDVKSDDNKQELDASVAAEDTAVATPAEETVAPSEQPAEVKEEVAKEEAATADEVATETAATAEVAEQKEEKAPAKKTTANKPAAKKPVNSAKKTTGSSTKSTKK